MTCVCVCFLQYLTEVQHLNLGFNQMDSIPVPPVQAGAVKFKLTTLILRNNNLQNLKGKQITKIKFSNEKYLLVSMSDITNFSKSLW